jgi:hypothetical protein
MVLHYKMSHHFSPFRPMANAMSHVLHIVMVAAVDCDAASTSQTRFYGSSKALCIGTKLGLAYGSKVLALETNYDFAQNPSVSRNLFNFTKLAISG